MLDQMVFKRMCLVYKSVIFEFVLAWRNAACTVEHDLKMNEERGYADACLNYPNLFKSTQSAAELTGLKPAA